jgi:SRSO17 transposase
MRHVEIYQLRWNIEKMFRTTKQHLGLQECSARKMETQESHIAFVLLAYALLQCDRKNQNLPTPEAALRAAERRKGIFLSQYIDRLDRFIHDACA